MNKKVEMEFVEWIEFGSHPFVKWTDFKNGKLVNYFTDEVNPENYSLEDLYKYWLEKIKDNETK